jgi:hypothetical protein
MRKTNLLVLSVLASVLLSSALFSIAAAQEDIGGTEPSVSDPDIPETSVDADAATKAADGQMFPRDSNTTEPDAPVGYRDDILYTTQDDGNILIAPAPGAEDANLVSEQTDPDYILVFAAIGIAVPVIVGAAIGLVVYHRRQAVNAQIVA